ncbi:1-deoxy-D-xylulose-5-phosphate synthase [Fodinisporobacter ferrooxydans]|uniref:1-deoxy-D-xylulose-5-phosphate synthase n=1 Tax=Fodinisporobacter ferrooxydans TaxID=2901836 RepID=A0ABY4CHW0_9BACL|nr:1-deoxy-D-xylulose-5-phosphate synthase [Alicyclobacillaceae bacterium MYW30-H2]
MLLERVNTPADIKQFSLPDLHRLAEEIRQFIIDSVTKTGGHFAPNLGVVELTIALHYIFDSPSDKIIWDVGHQSYVHKILTGRKEGFQHLRMYKGMSGFPKRSESEHDMFDTGHASTSISAALGMAIGRDLKGEKNQVIAVIGDGAMTGGMAFEALNHAGHIKKDMLVILNDNEMSISPNVGAISNYLMKLRTDPYYSRAKADIQHLLNKIPTIGDKVLKTLERVKDSLKYLMVSGMLFEEIGFTYLGPIDGHDLPSLIESLKQAKQTKGPVLLHVLTKKGKGYASAEDAPEKFHAVSPPKGPTAVKSPAPSYASIFANTMIRLAETDERVVAVTPAMLSGSGLNAFYKQFPDRCYDVGIAEQHAATLCAGLACSGLKPVLAIYSTFLQRAYDQMIHDICIQNLPVVFAVDRAGLVGPDGETHQGAFDIAYMRAIPNIQIMMPKDENELQHMLYTALRQSGPVAVRYPRADGLGVRLDQELKEIPMGKAEIIRDGKELALLALGPMVELAKQTAERLEAEGIHPMVVNMRFVKPLDRELLLDLAKRRMGIVTLEEASVAGGMGSAVLEFYAQQGITDMNVHLLGLPDQFIEHGSRDALLDSIGLNVDGIAEVVKMQWPKRKKRA